MRRVTGIVYTSDFSPYQSSLNLTFLFICATLGIRQVFLLELVEMLSGNTYFRCISMIF